MVPPPEKKTKQVKRNMFPKSCGWSSMGFLFDLAAFPGHPWGSDAALKAVGFFPVDRGLQVAVSSGFSGLVNYFDILLFLGKSWNWS